MFGNHGATGTACVARRFSRLILVRLRPNPEMTRPFHRCVAALFAIWFAVFTVDSARARSCPMHDGVHAASAHSAHHAGMAHSESASATEAGTSHDQHQSHRCTCTDASCCSGVVALLASACVD